MNVLVGLNQTENHTTNNATTNKTNNAVVADTISQDTGGANEATSGILYKIG